MSFLHIGASNATDSVPCHATEDWDALLAAWERGDDEEILRITLGARPTLMPRAALTAVPGPTASSDMDEVTREFWKRYAERHGDPSRKHFERRGDTEYSVNPLAPLSDDLVKKLLGGEE